MKKVMFASLGGFLLIRTRTGEMKKDSDLHIRIGKDLLQSFREYALIEGVSQSDLLRAFILDLVKGRISKPEAREGNSEV
jgi:hypothetical protein